jgi:hypothetical protein
LNSRRDARLCVLTKKRITIIVFCLYFFLEAIKYQKKEGIIEGRIEREKLAKERETLEKERAIFLAEIERLYRSWYGR